MKRPILIIVGLAVPPVLAHAECGWLLMEPPNIADIERDKRQPLTEWDAVFRA
jgi:hypothetical protein